MTQEVTIKTRQDGLIELVNVWEQSPLATEEINITAYPRVAEVIENPEPFIYKDGEIRERTSDEAETRCREIYQLVKEGRLARCKGDEIERHQEFFTAEELEEVELPEQAIKRLREAVKELRSRG